MKTLQNNFTTLEQSKRLLELGVSEFTADCLIKNNTEEDGPTIRVKEPCTAYYFAKNSYIPCWSVGRLIEIFLKCNTLGYRGVYFLCDRDDYEYSLIGYVVNVLESSINTNHMDFSKLEE